MDCLKEMAIQAGTPPPQPRILTLHETFMANVNRWGRVFETTFVPTYFFKSGEFLQKWQEGTLRDEIKLSWHMTRKGRFPLFPKSIKGKKEVRKILDQPKNRKTAL